MRVFVCVRVCVCVCMYLFPVMPMDMIRGKPMMASDRPTQNNAPFAQFFQHMCEAFVDGWFFPPLSHSISMLHPHLHTSVGVCVFVCLRASEHGSERVCVCVCRPTD